MVGDRTQMVQVPGRPNDPVVETPLFIVQEQSDMCSRCLCCGMHPMLAKFYHAQPVQAGEMVCCGTCYGGHKYLPDLNQPIAMTVERDGCCRKWIGCFIC